VESYKDAHELSDPQLECRLKAAKCAIKLQHLHEAVKQVTRAGLPDGLLSYQKSQFGDILEGLREVDVGIFYDHLS
jgi:hypothetical protein